MRHSSHGYLETVAVLCCANALSGWGTSRPRTATSLASCIALAEALAAALLCGAALPSFCCGGGPGAGIRHLPKGVPMGTKPNCGGAMPPNDGMTTGCIAGAMGAGAAVLADALVDDDEGCAEKRANNSGRLCCAA